MGFELFPGVVKEAIDDRVLDSVIYAFDLVVVQGWLAWQTGVSDSVDMAGAAEEMAAKCAVLLCRILSRSANLIPLSVSTA